MADRAISELIPANQVTPTDLFVLEQSGTAKKLTGATLERWLLDLADGHGGISSITKVETSGLVDTYRITLSDDTTFDFSVTNGKAISSVNQSSVNGLTRTYRISFNDGSHESFSVSDGRGISGFSKTSSSGLSDVYTLTYNDGTTDTITVNNGRGISNVEKVSTSGLEDTYKLSYNDGTSYEFTVKNGEKGDKGDNTYTHIKFASQEPTEESNSMGDVPDRWIGFYWGSSADAPEDWRQYRWYQFKGDKGDTGDPATLTSSSVEYQVSSSGTITPSGPWSVSIPVVAQGKYLWTRTTHNFNTGSPVVSYFVSRMGLDGSGSVSSVSNISPDSEGNVALEATDVGALPISGGNLTGNINMGGNHIAGLNTPSESSHATSKGYVDSLAQKTAPINLLKNGNFTNPVNQRGLSLYTGRAGYTIDMWRVTNRVDVEILNSHIKLTCTATAAANGFTQTLEYAPAVGERLTFVAMEHDGSLNVGTFNVPVSGHVVAFTTADGIGGRYYYDGKVTLMIPPEKSIEVDWVALFKGEYDTISSLMYRKNSYNSELLECQRYYQIRSEGSIPAVDMRPPMRIDAPTITILEDGNYSYSAEL